MSSTGPGRDCGRSRGSSVATAGWLLLVMMAGCKTKKELPFRPDETLKQELGLTDQDEVHPVTVTGGEVEHVDPDSVSVPAGAYVEFITGDGRVHEVHFQLDSLNEAARSFLVRSDQESSPPLVDRDSRFVVWFGRAPPGRYPYLVRGNGGPTRGVVIVRPKP